MKRIYQFFCDSELTFLKVPRKELYELNIADKISQFSKQHGDYVYLDMEDDLMFIEERKMLDEPMEFRESYSSKISAIRSYPSYSPA